MPAVPKDVVVLVDFGEVRPLDGAELLGRVTVIRVVGDLVLVDELSVALGSGRVLAVGGEPPPGRH